MKCVIDKYYKRNIHYNIRELAIFCNISTQTVYGYLESKIIPSLSKAIIICDFFAMVNQCHCIYPINFQIQDFWILEEDDLKD